MMIEVWKNEKERGKKGKREGIEEKKRGKWKKRVKRRRDGMEKRG
ncbi:hypothetical protein [Actinobacillus pleuropneumoniae]|nr:hypothetical protein [Actinobacillus pleuropneumoniae]